jgi:hypothetical protein
VWGDDEDHRFHHEDFLTSSYSFLWQQDFKQEAKKTG